jgi:hypothetical protein
MSGDRNAEAIVQAAIVEYIRTVAPGPLVFHIANGGYRTKAEAARFKSIGVQAGLPDLCLIGPGGRVYFIECKSPSGRLSAAQRVMHAALRTRLNPRDRCLDR